MTDLQSHPGLAKLKASRWWPEGLVHSFNLSHPGGWHTGLPGGGRLLREEYAHALLRDAACRMLNASPKCWLFSFGPARYPKKPDGEFCCVFAETDTRIFSWFAPTELLALLGAIDEVTK